MNDYIHERSPRHMTRDELLDLIAWYEKAMNGMAATIRRLDEALATETTNRIGG